MTDFFNMIMLVVACLFVTGYLYPMSYLYYKKFMTEYKFYKRIITDISESLKTLSRTHENISRLANTEKARQRLNQTKSLYTSFLTRFTPLLPILVPFVVKLYGAYTQKNNDNSFDPLIRTTLNQQNGEINTNINEDNQFEKLGDKFRNLFGEDTELKVTSESEQLNVTPVSTPEIKKVDVPNKKLRPDLTQNMDVGLLMKNLVPIVTNNKEDEEKMLKTLETNIIPAMGQIRDMTNNLLQTTKNNEKIE